MNGIAAPAPLAHAAAWLRRTEGSLEEAGGHAGGLAVRALAFAALATFTAEHWSALVADPPLARMVLVVAIATAAGAAVALVPSFERERWRTGLARAGIAVAALGLALAAVGLSSGLLAPAGWGELAGEISRGLTGLRTVEWPYSGPDDWVRLTILLAVPAVVTPAAMLAFWPRHRAQRRLPRTGALVLLLGLYGVAIAQLDRGEPVARGAVVLVLVAAWVFLPRVRGPEATRAGVALLGAGTFAALVSTGLPAAAPVLDYRAWRWVGDTTTFQWDHSYGAIDWPRRGEVVMTIESDRPHYWRAVTLDSFDGFRWVRSLAGASTLTSPEPPAPQRPSWNATVDVTVGSLVSELLVSPGQVRRVEGVESTIVARDGTVEATTELEQGRTYTVAAYAPNPGLERMRDAPDVVPASVSSSTLIQLPGTDAPNPESPAASGDYDPPAPAISFPRQGEVAARTDAVRAVLASPYARTYRLARRLAAPAPTTYDAVRRIEEYLRSGYSYSEKPPASQYPLDSFLFEERFGYCQQFAGAMALMLRMNGIPARVVGGFAPGSRVLGTHEFTVRDVDAHSWVEVHFQGIGWVPFDPTPPDAPADSQGDGTVASAARGSSGRPVGLGDLFRGEPGAAGLAPAGLGGVAGEGAGAASPAIVRQATVPVAVSSGGSSGVWLAGAGLFAFLTAFGLPALLALRRDPRGPEDAELRELWAALDRLGQRPRERATLLELERRLDRSGQPGAADHVRRLRRRRFGPPGAAAPAAGGRRALRRALTAGGGARGVVRGYLALPPRFTAN